jgi:hypothetical protein
MNTTTQKLAAWETEGLWKIMTRDDGVPVIGWIYDSHGKGSTPPQYFGSSHTMVQKLSASYCCTVYRRHISTCQGERCAIIKKMEQDEFGKYWEYTVAEIPVTDPRNEQEILDAAIAIAMADDGQSELSLQASMVRAEKFAAAMADVPALLSREQYEAACARLGVTPGADPESTYSARYYDYAVGGFRSLSLERQIALELSLRRGRLMAADEDAMPVPASVVTRRDFGMHGIRYDEACDNCGRITEVDNSTGRCRRCH